MAAPIKLLQLPWLVLREILGYLDILDIIMLSLASPSLFALAKSTNRQLDHIQWGFDDEDIEFGTYLELAVTNEVEEWMFKFPCPEQMEQNRVECCEGEQYSDEFSECTVQGHTFFISQPACGKIVVDYGQPSKELRRQAIKLFSYHFWSLFRYEEHKLCYQSKDSIIDCFVFDHTKKFALLEVGNNEDDGGVMTTEEIRFVLESLDYEEIDFRPRAADRSYLRPLTSKNITMENARWIGIESLINSVSIGIFIFDDSLVDVDLNMILRTWIDGRLPNLQSFVMKFSVRRQMHSRSRIFRGIWSTPADETNRPSYFPEISLEKWVKNADAVDIKTNDGMLTATVTLGKHWGTKGFRMFVWHDNYNLPEDE